MTEEEITAEATKSLVGFFDSIDGPPDVYKQILLEEFFAAILGDVTTETRPDSPPS